MPCYPWTRGQCQKERLAKLEAVAEAAGRYMADMQRESALLPTDPGSLQAVAALLGSHHDLEEALSALDGKE